MTAYPIILCAMVPHRDEENDAELDTHVDRPRPRGDGGSYSRARMVVATGITILWGAVNYRYYFANGPEVTAQFNLICGGAVAYIVGVEGLVRRLRGKDKDE